MSAQDYEEWLKERLQPGGWITATDHRESGGILVSFSYFGDR
jgi:hypothetical protein